jgi:hypothetical protein
MPCEQPGLLDLFQRRQTALPRKTTLASTVPSMLNAIIDTEALDNKQGRTERIFALAAAWGHQPSQVWRVAARKVGLKPPLLWDLGWALRDCGVAWMSGPAALSFEPAYKGHLLGAVGEVLALAPADKIRASWSTFSALCSDQTPAILLEATNQRIDPDPTDRGLQLQETTPPARERMRRHYLERITESRHPWTFATDDSWNTAATRDKEFVQRSIVARVTMDDELEHAFRRAWTTWWGKEQTEQLPLPIQTLIEGLRINISQHLYDGACAELSSWFRLMESTSSWGATSSTCGS